MTRKTRSDAIPRVRPRVGQTWRNTSDYRVLRVDKIVSDHAEMVNVASGRRTRVYLDHLHPGCHWHLFTDALELNPGVRTPVPSESEEVKA